MKAKELLSRAETALGIKQLTTVQQKMLSLSGTSDNIVVTAPTGSGKTLAFLLNVIPAMRPADGTVQTVVIVPSRELAMQVGEVARRITTGDYRTVVCYGGHPFQEEERSLAAGADIVVATPGRLLDHLKRETLDVSQASYLVLDEYDKSLELGFSDEMKRIVKRLPRLRRTVMTSATRIAEWPDWLPKRPVKDVADEGVAAAEPVIEVVRVDSYQRDKLPALNDLLRAIEGSGRTIVFVNYRESAERVEAFLRKAGYPVGLYHGGLEQVDRENALEKLANGTTPVLVATDLGARGLDISGIENVVHYHMPTSEQAWTHRNGRTARMGATGNVYVIVSEDETVPEYMRFDRSWTPPEAPATRPEPSAMATLWFGAGRKDKLSKGDIVGFLTQAAGLGKQEVGRILLRDHNALVAVAADKAAHVEAVAAAEKVKGKKIRIRRI